MLVCTGGRQRSEAEFRALYDSPRTGRWTGAGSIRRRCTSRPGSSCTSAPDPRTFRWST